MSRPPDGSDLKSDQSAGGFVVQGVVEPLSVRAILWVYPNKYPNPGGIMTAAPRGASKAASENEDAVTNAKTTNTNARVRKSTAKSVAEGEPLPKAQPEDVSKPGDEARPAEDDNATPTGAKRPENDPDKHPAAEDPFADEDDEPREKGTNTSTEFDGSASVPENTSSPLGLDPSTSDKSDKLKDRNIADLEKGDLPSAEELPEFVPGPNLPVPQGQVEVTRKARAGEPSDPGGRVSEQQKTGKQRAPKTDPLKDLSDLSKLPVAVAVGQVTGEVQEYSGQPVLSLSLRGWVGEAPLKILASDIGDLEQVIAELRTQLKD